MNILNWIQRRHEEVRRRLTAGGTAGGVQPTNISSGYNPIFDPSSPLSPFSPLHQMYHTNQEPPCESPSNYDSSAGAVSCDSGASFDSSGSFDSGSSGGGGGGTSFD